MTDHENGWTIETLRVYVLTKIEEADKRYEQRFNDQQQAIVKQEVAIERRFEGVNELRGALDDAAKLLMPRAEAVAHYDSLVQKIDDHGKQDTVSHSGFTARLDGISHRLDLKEGEALGSKDTKGDSRATWAIAIAVATVIVQGYSFVVGHASSSTPASPQVIYVPAAPGTLVPGPQTQPPTR